MRLVPLSAVRDEMKGFVLDEGEAVVMVVAEKVQVEVEVKQYDDGRGGVTTVVSAAGVG